MTSSKNTEGEGLLQADLAVLAGVIRTNRAGVHTGDIADALQRIHDRLSSAALPSVPADAVKPLPDESLRSRIGEIGNQVHNFATERQNDDDLLDRLTAIRTALWELAQQASADAVKPAVAGEGGLRDVDLADLDAMFSRIPSGPYSADARGESWEVRAIDTDPTNRHHWPYRLCESIRGQKAGCDPDVFGFIAGVINAWPSIRAGLSTSVPAGVVGWQTMASAPVDEWVILATSGEWVGEAMMLRDEDTGKQEWTWAGGVPVRPSLTLYGWQHMPEPLDATPPAQEPTR